MPIDINLSIQVRVSLGQSEQCAFIGTQKTSPYAGSVGVNFFYHCGDNAIEPHVRLRWHKRLNIAQKKKKKKEKNRQ